MTDYKVGYGKPPLDTRFRSGVSGNPNGRPKRHANSLVESVERVLSSPIKYRERGRTKSSTFGELTMQMLVDRAANGEVPAAKAMLKAYMQAERNGEAGVEKIVIKNWISTALSRQTGRPDAYEVAPAADAKPDGSSHPPKSEPKVE